jgi:integrase
MSSIASARKRGSAVPLAGGDHSAPFPLRRVQASAASRRQTASCGTLRQARHRGTTVGGKRRVPVIHSFRKTVATLIDDEGLSARIGADHLGHTRISMTQDNYMARGRVHTAVADLLGRTINDE